MAGQRAWIFQSTPSRYDLVSALDKLDEMTWLVNQYKSDIHTGDRVYLWETGEAAGIVGLAHVLTEPATLSEDDAEREFWRRPEEFRGPRVRVRLGVEKRVKPRLARSSLVEDPILGKLRNLKFSNATNFPLTQEQDEALTVRMNTASAVGRRERIVKIAPGERGELWEQCRAGGYICVGWDQVGDLRAFSDKATFRREFARHYEYGGNRSTVSKKANELWTLLDLTPGDLVVANGGLERILAIGTVQDPGYEFRPELGEVPHTVRVQWDESFARDIPRVGRWFGETVAQLSAEQIRALLPELVQRAESEVGHFIAVTSPKYPNTWERSKELGQWGATTDDRIAKSVEIGDCFLVWVGGSGFRATAEFKSRVREVAPTAENDWGHAGKEYRFRFNIGRVRDYPTVFKPVFSGGRNEELGLSTGHLQRPLLRISEKQYRTIVDKLEALNGPSLRRPHDSPDRPEPAGDFDELWRQLVALLRQRRQWRTLVQNVVVTSVDANSDAVTFETPRSVGPRSVTREAIRRAWTEVRDQGSSGVGFLTTAKKALVALLPNIEYSVSPLVLHWTDDPHPLGEVRSRGSGTYAQAGGAAHFVGEIRGDNLPTSTDEDLDDDPSDLVDGELECELTESNLVVQQVRSLLNDGYGGILFVGPPGTSKTWYALQIAALIAERDPRRVRNVQFHPSYQYEDFVEGYVPRDGGGFRLSRKHLSLMCRRAEGDPNNTHVLVIDELSRSDPSRVFGEALTYIERRGMPFRAASGRMLSIPSNLVFLATMNAFDRGVDEVDAAFDRRFGRIELLPSEARLTEILTSNGVELELRSKILEYFAWLQKHGNPFARIGHAYFIRVGDLTTLWRLWDHQLRFVLEKAYRLDPEGLRSAVEVWRQTIPAMPATEDASTLVSGITSESG